ncbi:magnesium transporter CorA family protein [Nonomuraea sp. NPDC000554]|uniref:magnesium transporter CorA family protein n=1 Tax=Nonomuraea sp. NPDC000554 TaxID=3154259 RepID=UPI003321B3A4
MAHTRLYRNGVLDAEGFPIADVSDYVGDPSCTIWFDLCSPTPDDLAVISEELGLHALAVEDVLHDRQRPKLDVYDTHLFLAVYGERLDTETGDITSTEIDIFVTRNALVTVRENDQFDVDEVIRRWDANREMAKHGVGFLLHGLLDYVVDGHFEIIQSLDDQIEQLENHLFDNQISGRDLQQRTFAMRKNLVQFRRAVLPMREVINSLIRRDLHVVEPAMAPYYQDVYDHVMRVTEWTDSLRDLVGNIRETSLTQQSYRLNDIMKKLTSWAAIIAVPTMITGFYGQNVPYPGAEQPIGFWVSTLVIIVASSSLYLLFRKQDWL